MGESLQPQGLQGKRPVFIVVEGLDGVGKTTLTAALAEELGAQVLKSPPLVSCQGLSDNVRQHFDGKPPVRRRAFYRFANLLASEQARAALDGGRSVVMDRYWTSTAAFAALDFEVGSAADGPDASVPLGKYPPELLQPDVTLVLKVSEECRLARLHGRDGADCTPEEQRLALDESLRHRVMERYEAFPIKIIDTSERTPRQVLQSALREIVGEGLD